MFFMINYVGLNDWPQTMWHPKLNQYRLTGFRYFCISRIMELYVIEQLAALSHSKRLGTFRLLMRRYPDFVSAGELSEHLNVPASTMSSNLAILYRAGLIEQVRSGTYILYSVNMKSVAKFYEYLFADCGRYRFSIEGVTGLSEKMMSTKKFNVLFICVGNSARSIFAETLLRDAAGDRFNVYSAGTHPGTELNPFAVKVLMDKGHEVSLLRAKDISEFTSPTAPHFDFVFTVCNLAANEACPAWEGQPISGHWGMPDPVKVTGTDAEKSLAFQQCYGMLKRRIDAFISIPIRELDRIAMQTAVDEIAKI